MRSVVLTAALILASVATLEAQSAKKKPTRPLPKPKPAVVAAEKTDLFAGMDDGRLAVRFIPRDEKLAQVTIANIGKVPLEVTMPNVFAGAPVLAQAAVTSDGRYDFGTLVSSTPPQTLGGVYPTVNLSVAPATSANRPNARPSQSAAISIAPGRMVQFTVPCVCLQYGNPTPRPEIPYQLVKLDTFTKKPEVAALLAEFSQGRIDQPVVQLAAWHFSNNLSFEDLAEIDFASNRLDEALRLATYVRSEVRRQQTEATAGAGSPKEEYKPQ